MCTEAFNLRGKKGWRQDKEVLTHTHAHTIKLNSLIFKSLEYHNSAETCYSHGLCIAGTMLLLSVLQ